MNLPLFIIESSWYVKCDWLGLEKRKDTMHGPLAGPLSHHGSEDFTQTCALNVEALLGLPVGHSTSGVLGHVVMAARGRLIGECMPWREGMHA